MIGLSAKLTTPINLGAKYGKTDAIENKVISRLWFGLKLCFAKGRLVDTFV